jgi:two-component system OmpR family response regulator
MKILVVEDDHAIGGVVCRALGESGHVVDWEHDGRSGEATAIAGAYDAIVLDVMLPEKDGLAVARTLRSAGMRVPILMLTARHTPADAVAGLNAGADDYLRKPFGLDELEARLHAIVRREPSTSRELRVGDLVMDLGTRVAYRGPRRLDLSARETAFLEYFMRNAGLLLTRPMLEDALWERDRDTVSNLIEVYIRRLRRKLCENGEAALIHTVRGAGYRFGGQRR